MTGIERDFDRIARAWLDLGPNEAPDRAVDAVLQAIETTPQVRRPFRWPTWRSTTMTRITLLAVLAGTIAIAIAGLVISGGGPAPGPSEAPPDSPAAVVATPTPTPGPVPVAVKGGWTAASRGTALEDPTITTINIGGSSVDGNAPLFSVDRPGFSRLYGSNVVEPSPGLLRVTLISGGTSGCATSDAGEYRWSVTPDGQWLSLELVEDACAIRGEILPGTWQRNLGFSSPGGPGIAVNFEPYVTFTLPAEPWTGNEFAEADTLAIDNSDGTADLRLWKDPDGFSDACDRGAPRLDLEPGIDAFLAYLRESPQFTVIGETESTLDGHRAVEVEIRLGDAIEQPCAPLDGSYADRSGILLWASHGAPRTFWNGTFGDQWTLIVTEVDGATILLEVARQEGSAWPIDRSVADSIRFVDGLPEPPAS